MEGLRLLTARSDGDTLFAVLPQRELIGEEYREGLAHDFSRLSQSEVAAIRLDLQAVEFIDGAFMGLLLRLVRSLLARGERLTVVASDHLREVLQITRFDRLFEVIPAVPLEAAASPGRGAPSAS
ncbi:MAG: STAS domain-containing protein [Gemmataceae bacterium]